MPLGFPTPQLASAFISRAPVALFAFLPARGFGRLSDRMVAVLAMTAVSLSIMVSFRPERWHWHGGRPPRVPRDGLALVAAPLALQVLPRTQAGGHCNLHFSCPAGWQGTPLDFLLTDIRRLVRGASHLLLDWKLQLSEGTS